MSLFLSVEVNGDILFRMEFQVNRFSQVEAVSNTTKLFVSCKGRFSVYDFWKDGSARVLIDDDSEDDSEDDFEFDSEDDSEGEEVEDPDPGFAILEVEEDLIDD